MASETGQYMSRTPWHDGYSEKRPLQKKRKSRETAFGLNENRISEGGKLREWTVRSEGEVAPKKLP